MQRLLNTQAYKQPHGGGNMTRFKLQLNVAELETMAEILSAIPILISHLGLEQTNKVTISLTPEQKWQLTLETVTQGHGFQLRNNQLIYQDASNNTISIGFIQNSNTDDNDVPLLITHHLLEESLAYLQYKKGLIQEDSLQATVELRLLKASIDALTHLVRKYQATAAAPYLKRQQTPATVDRVVELELSSIKKVLSSTSSTTQVTTAQPSWSWLSFLKQKITPSANASSVTPQPSSSWWYASKPKVTPITLSNANQKTATRPKNQIKILLLSDQHVEKSAMLKPSTDYKLSKFPEWYNVHGIAKRDMIIAETRVELQIWDLGVAPEHITPNYYQHADAVLMMYNADNQKSFNFAKSCSVLISEQNVPTVMLYLMACSNTNQVITQNQGNTFATQLKIGYSECSLANLSSMNDFYEAIAQQVVQNQQAAIASDTPRVRR